MTRKEAKLYIGELKMYGKSRGWDEEYLIACDIALNELEQESVLDRVRAEIEELDYITFDGITKRRCLEIIDKYKADKEQE